MRSSRGVALVLVLWLTTLLTVMASAFALSSRRESQLARLYRDRSEGLALIEGALHYTQLRLNVQDKNWRWRGDGAVYEVIYGGGRVRLELRDEAGKLDLNSAPPAALQALLIVAGAPPNTASRLANVILDWRDRDALRRQGGAEAEDYRLAGKDFGPSNRPFRSVDELQAILGMTPELYQRIEPWLTVYTHQANLDLAAMPATLLTALSRMDADLRQWLANPRNAKPPTKVAGLTVGTSRSAALGIHAQALLKNGERTGLDVVLGRGRGQGLHYLRWREGNAVTTDLFAGAAIERVVLEPWTP